MTYGQCSKLFLELCARHSDFLDYLDIMDTPDIPATMKLAKEKRFLSYLRKHEKRIKPVATLLIDGQQGYMVARAASMWLHEIKNAADWKVPGNCVPPQPNATRARYTHAIQVLQILLEILEESTELPYSVSIIKDAAVSYWSQREEEGLKTINHCVEYFDCLGGNITYQYHDGTDLDLVQKADQILEPRPLPAKLATKSNQGQPSFGSKSAINTGGITLLDFVKSKGRTGSNATKIKEQFERWMERNGGKPKPIKKGFKAVRGCRLQPDIFSYVDLDAKWHEYTD